MKKRIIIIITILILVLPFIPVKMCVNTIPNKSDSEFCFIRHDGMKGWLLAGNENGLFDWDTVPDRYVNIENKHIEDVVSGDLYLDDPGTTFIVWGNIECTEIPVGDDGNLCIRDYTVKCEKWSVFGEVHKRNTTRTRNYLTIFDYKWYDTFREFFGVYSEY